ncbi:mucin-13-like isoform X6 [Gadus macrocephalus]|uniref:mucin-13-like isoform X6 n=1 Tax=Gadus macrocephalus TaxID=80720 RepID=UPI0028CB8516|nr:mucin-13-like isoform X6 [Gadus macrocephalus]
MARFKGCAFFVVFLLLVAGCQTEVPTTTTGVPTTTPEVPTTTTGVPTTIPGVPTTTTGVPTTTPEVPTTTTGVPTTIPGVSTTPPGVPTTTPEVSTTTPGVPTTTPEVPTTTPGVPTTTPEVPTTTTGVPTTIPGVSTTPPGVPTTTPEVSTTTPGVPTTTPEVPTTTPEVPTTTPDVTTITPDVTTAPPSTSDPCNKNPCGGGSTCQRRFNETYTCLCLVGMNYDENERQCADAKVFPGKLELLLPWDKQLKIKTSECFKKQSEYIIAMLNKTFKDLDVTYLKSTVLEFNPSESVEMNLRKNKNTTATVENLFQLSSNANDSWVRDTVLKAIENDTLIASFNAINLCDRNACDKATTNCKTGDEGSFNCSCVPGYLASKFSTRACFACPSGERPYNDTHCYPCAFGKSGFNCEESWQLALVIVGSVLGGLLFLMAIVVGVLSCRPSRKSSKKTSGTEEDAATYYSHSLAKAPLINPNGPMPVAANGFPKIPRATSTRDPLGGGRMEMTPNNSQLIAGPRAGHAAPHVQNRDPYEQNRATTNPYVQNREPYEQNQATTNPYVQNRDPYEQNRATTNPYVQNRDPYEQNRAMNNPYVQNQAYNNKKRGYTNSNYMHDDERSY